MKDIKQVIEEKTAEFNRVNKELYALKIVLPLLEDRADADITAAIEKLESHEK